MDLVASLKAVAVLACIRGVVRILTFILSGDFQTFKFLRGKKKVFEVVLRLISLQMGASIMPTLSFYWTHKTM